MSDNQGDKKKEELATGVMPHNLPAGARKALEFVRKPVSAVAQKTLSLAKGTIEEMGQRCQD